MNQLYNSTDMNVTVSIMFAGPPANVGGAPGGPPPQQQQPYMGEIAPMDSTHQTMMWQQNQYMVDSGIHSGMTTQAPSVSSKHGPLDMPMDACDDMDAPRLIYDFDNGFTHGGYGPEQVDG